MYYNNNIILNINNYYTYNDIADVHVCVLVPIGPMQTVPSLRQVHLTLVYGRRG